MGSKCNNKSITLKYSGLGYIIDTIHSKYQLDFPELFKALQQVVTKNGVQASNYDLFKGAIFGRDSLRVALDLLPWYPAIARIVILNLAGLQGERTNFHNEEEPGKIPHEYRHLFFDGKKISKDQEKRLFEMAQIWGWSRRNEEVCYFGSVDATPQFIRLIYRYWQDVDRSILDKKITVRSGLKQTIRQSVLSAVRWTARRIIESDLNLLEFCHDNPLGIKWQVMRDGSTAYLHPDGTLANAHAPIASFETQGLAYDAFIEAAEMLETDFSFEAERWRQLASKLQQQALKLFWMENEGYFAMAIDRDRKLVPRQVKSITSVPAEILESGLFESLPSFLRQRYVAAIVKRMYSPDFLTDVGIRSRALCHLAALNYCDYQGSSVSWPVMTNIFAIGLRRQGLPRLAQDLENRLVNAARISESLNEFYYVMPDGRVNYHPQKRVKTGAEHEAILGTNIPENIQAWTVSAILKSILVCQDNLGCKTNPFYNHLENEILAQYRMPLLTPEEIEIQKSISSPFYIDQAEGVRREIALLQQESFIL